MSHQGGPWPRPSWNSVDIMILLRINGDNPATYEPCRALRGVGSTLRPVRPTDWKRSRRPVQACKSFLTGPSQKILGLWKMLSLGSLIFNFEVKTPHHIMSLVLFLKPLMQKWRPTIVAWYLIVCYWSYICKVPQFLNRMISMMYYSLMLLV